MKPVHFEYTEASSIEEALDALQSSGGDAKIIAGGQSLVPLLNMRLARPAHLVDINNLPLNTIQVSSQKITVGATVRQRSLEGQGDISSESGLLGKCLKYIGHPQTRNRGTVVGSIVHGDPSAELPLVATVLDAEVELVGSGGSRTASIHDLYFGYMMTGIEADEIAVSVRFYPGTEGKVSGSGFAEIARKHGDFAIAAASCEICLSEQNEVERLRFAFGGVHPTPLRFFDLEQQVRGQVISNDFIREFVARACDELEPDSDLNASSEYRTHLAGVLGVRALQESWADALQRRGEAR